MSKNELNNFIDHQTGDAAKAWWEKEIAECAYAYRIPQVPSYHRGPRVCVDIGANVGAFCAHASPHFERIFAYEPVKSNFNIARENLNKINNVKLMNYAVAADSGKTVKIGRYADKEHNYSGNCSIYNDVSKEYEICETINLEDIYEKNNITYIDYMKVDCEGSEYDLLIGKDLSKINFLAMEIHPGFFGEEKNVLLHNHLNRFFDLLLASPDGNILFLVTKSEKPERF